LGVELDDRLDGNDYRASFKMIEACFVRRLSNPLFLSDTIFNIFAAHQYEKGLNCVHNFSSDIIQKRRSAFEKEFAERSSEKRSCNEQDE